MLVASCSGAAAPDCTEEVFGTPDERAGNAGCLIETGGRVLLLAHRPGGRLGVPGGTAEAGEPAQCTAHRETWEETGLGVQVGEFLMRFDTGFLLYACTAPGLDGHTPPTLPNWALLESQALVWSDLTDVEPGDWRFPDQLDALKSLLRQRRADERAQ